MLIEKTLVGRVSRPVAIRFQCAIGAQRLWRAVPRYTIELAADRHALMVIRASGQNAQSLMTSCIVFDCLPQYLDDVRQVVFFSKPDWCPGFVPLHEKSRT